MKTGYTLVGMTTKQAQWLGMAASVAGGCVAVTESAGYAIAKLGWSGPEQIGLVPDAWLQSGDYTVLTPAQIASITASLTTPDAGWSGAARLNADALATAKMLHLI